MTTPLPLRFLAFVLRDEVRVVEIEDIDVRTLVIEGESFANKTWESSPDYWTGFYDWVVADGVIVALRYIPFDDVGDFGALSRRRSYVTAENGMYEIRLPTALAVPDQRDPPSPAWNGLDQVFPHNAVFRSRSGHVVVTVRIEDDGPYASLLG